MKDCRIHIAELNCAKYFLGNSRGPKEAVRVLKHPEITPCRIKTIANDRCPEIRNVPQKASTPYTAVEAIPMRIGWNRSASMPRK